MRTLLLALLFGGAVCCSATAAPQKYSATWVLDPNRSVLEDSDPRSLTLSVVETAADLKVTVRQPDSQHTYSVPADGTASRETVGSDQYTRTSMRANGVLVIRTVFIRGFDKASLTYSERWTLSRDGRTLTIYTTFPGGRDMLRVFSKKE